MKSSNYSTVELTNGCTVALSYGVPIAVHVPGKGYSRRARKYSRTTSKHANQFAGNTSPEVDEETFARLIAPLSLVR
jgi:hypothetical protein